MPAAVPITLPPTAIAPRTSRPAGLRIPHLPANAITFMSGDAIAAMIDPTVPKAPNRFFTTSPALSNPFPIAPKNPFLGAFSSAFLFRRRKNWK